jgi:hypothetical protein
MVPGNPLEHALVAAAAEASARPLFYRLLLESPLLLLDASAAPQLLDEKTVLEKGTQVKAVSIDVDGIQHTAVFSSLSVLQEFVRAEHRYISVQATAANLERESRAKRDSRAPRTAS